MDQPVAKAVPTGEPSASGREIQAVAESAHLGGPMHVVVANPGLKDKQGEMVHRTGIVATLVLASTVLGRAQTADMPATSNEIPVETTAHLTYRTYSRPTSAAPGRRVSLVVEIEPMSGIHVYAPGDHDYRVISLTLTPQPVFRALPFKYPASEIHLFEPLNERVAVYSKPFTLVQDVIISDTADARRALGGGRPLTVSGTLAYQACDDRLCFNAVTVPVSWTLDVMGRAAKREKER